MTARDDRILSRDFVLLFLGNFIATSIYFLLMTTMAYYAVTSYGVDSSLAGLTASIFLIGGVTGRIVCGRAAGRIDPRRLGIAAMGVQLLMCCSYLAGSAGIGALIAIRLVHGLSFGVVNTVLPAMAVDRLPATRLGEGTGYYMLSNSLGVGVGPLMSILVVMGFDYRVLFGICIGLSAVSLATTILVRPPARDAARTAQAPAQPEPSRRGLDSIIDTSTFKLSVFMFLVAFAYSSLNSFVNNYAIQLGMGGIAPFIFLVYSITLLITRPLMGKVQDRCGDNCVLYPSIASMGLGLLLAAFATTPVALLACGIFMATGFGTCMAVGQTAAIKATRGHSTSLTISTFFLLCDGGCGIGPFMLGFVITGAGYQAMYVVAAAVAFCAVAYYHVVHGRSQRRRHADQCS